MISTIKKLCVRNFFIGIIAFVGACAPIDEKPVQAPDSISDRARADRDNAPAPIPVERRSDVYAFKGMEGQWGGAIIGDFVYLDSPTSAGWYSREIVIRELSPGGEIIRADRGLVLTKEEGGCYQNPLGDNWPDRVIVVWDGGISYACGNFRDPDTPIAGSNWELLQFGQAPAPENNRPAATVQFDKNGRIGGTVSCNDGGVAMTWNENGTFTAESMEVIQTEILCESEDVMLFASKFWENMPTAKSWVRDGDSMTITFTSGQQARLRLLY